MRRNKIYLKNNKKILLCAQLLLLASTFLFLVDDKFRGWSDTHQYQIEAKVWKSGERPPSSYLLRDSENSACVGPTHVPPLTPFLWSRVVDLSNQSKTVFYISLLQAFLLSWTFIIFVLLVGNKKLTIDGIFFGIILFFHPLIRWWVFMPMSEPLSLALLVTSYYFSRFAGVGAALQILTRPPVFLLHLPLLYRWRKNLFIIGSFLLMTAIGFLFFGSLVFPSKFRGMGYDFYKTYQVFSNFTFESSLVFKRLFPYTQNWFQWLWGIFIVSFVIFVWKKNYRNYLFGVSALLYFLTILLASGESYRYLFPLVLVFFIEFKPKIPKNLFFQTFAAILALHLVVQQIEAIKDLRGDRFPETDSVGLKQTRTWIKDNFKSDDLIMMYRYRFCINYFDHPCVSIPDKKENIIGELKRQSVKLVVINRLYWQFEETDFEKELQKQLLATNYPLKINSREFENVRVIVIKWPSQQ